MQDGRLLFITSDGGPLLPAWQLQRDPASPALPLVKDIANSFPGDLAVLHHWMLLPNVDLEGLSPAEALTRREAPEVLAVAAAIGAAGR
jgi:hypothetical protein